MPIERHPRLQAQRISRAEAGRLDRHPIAVALFGEKVPDQRAGRRAEHDLQPVLAGVAAAKDAVLLPHVAAGHETVTTHIVDLDRQVLGEQLHRRRALNGHHHRLLGGVVQLDVATLHVLLKMRDDLRAITRIADHQPAVFVA